MSSFAEIAEVFYSTIEERDDHDARLRAAEPGVSRLEKKRRAAYAKRSRSRAYRCGRCDEFGHNKRACTAEARMGMRGNVDDHFQMIRKHFDDLEFVAWAGSWRRKGPQFTVTERPFNTRIDTVGTHTFEVRLTEEDGLHLVALFEWRLHSTRCTFATKTVRAECDKALVKLREAFG